MKAIILAAGRGSRMKGLTENQPKCFTVLHGKRLIDWQLDALRSAGADEIAIVRGYMGDSFPYDITYFENTRWAETNMLMSLCTAGEWLRRDTCIISYSDIVYGAGTVERLRQGTGDICITYDPDWLRLWSLRFEDPLSDAETFRLNAGDEVVEIGGRASSVEEIKGQYMGLLKFTPAGWGQVEEYLSRFSQDVLDQMDMTKLLQGLIASGVKVHAIRIGEPWYEVDNEQDLAQYSLVKDLGFKNQTGDSR